MPPSLCCCTAGYKAYTVLVALLGLRYSGYGVLGDRPTEDYGADRPSPLDVLGNFPAGVKRVSLKY